MIHRIIRYTLTTLLLLVSVCSFTYSQNHNISNLAERSVAADFDNIYVEKLNSDEHGTSYLIWVKKEVKSHIHKNHSEHVYILEGKGIIILGEKETEIKPGDLIFIPQGTVHAVKVNSDSVLKVLSLQTPEFFGKDRHFIQDSESAE